MKQKLSIRWLYLSVGVLVLLAAGIIYAWSLLKAPFAEELHWDAAALSLNFTFTMCFFCLGGLFSGLLAKKLSGAIRLTAAGVLCLAGFFLVSILNPDRLWLLYLGYGLMAGTGIGIVYNVVIATVNAWFPDRKGLCSGALMMGFGFSTLLFGNFLLGLFDESKLGWRKTYLLLGAILFVLFVLAAAVLRLPSADTVFPVPARSRKAGTAPVENVTTAEMLKRGSFWKLFLFFILFASVGSTAISGAKNQFEALGAVEAASLLAGFVTVFNGLGRIVSGAFFDAFGLRKTQYLTSGVVIAATLLTFLGYLCQLSPLGIAGLCLCGFSYGFSPTVSAAFVIGFYGPKDFALNFPILNLILIPASFVPTLAASLNWGNTVTFAVLTAFSVVGLFLGLSIRKA